MTSAREAVLADVRRALRGAPAPPTTPRLPTPAVPSDLVGLFVERVEDYRATVVRCALADVESAIGDALAGVRPVVPPGLPWAVSGAVVDDALSATELDGIAAVVTAATVGIATTGTIVLDHGPDQGRRAISLVPDLHVCVVREDQVVVGVTDAMGLLDPGRPLTWISGPSATSDIELNRVEGVHGPRTLHVVVAG